MNVIAFSKDRAMQLDAFLRSYARHVVLLPPLHVLTVASNARHATAYAGVFRAHPFAVQMEQGASFKADLLALLPAEGNVIFFVDDQIFTRDWEVLELPGLSLRLGPNLRRDYASNDALQALPSFEITAHPGILSWRWDDGGLSWRYPLSLDGHVFDLREMRTWIESLAFSSPNTLESALQQFLPSYAKRRGFCYCMSRVVNVPWNRVQTDWYNRHGDGNDAEMMLGWWEAGRRLNLSSIDGVVNQSVHQEFPLVLEDRC